MRLRMALDLLGEHSSPETEWARKQEDRDRLRTLLAAEGLIDENASRDDIVVAMHALLSRTPCRLVAASIGDAIGDLRQPNLPGTVDEYPNWQLPLAVPDGDDHRGVTLEDALDHPLLQRVVATLAEARPGR